MGFRDVGEGVSHPMLAAALQGRGKHAADGSLQPLMGVGDDQLGAT
jgi:hypothetical protein